MKDFEAWRDKLFLQLSEALLGGIVRRIFSRNESHKSCEGQIHSHQQIQQESCIQSNPIHPSIHSYLAFSLIQPNLIHSSHPSTYPIYSITILQHFCWPFSRPKEVGSTTSVFSIHGYWVFGTLGRMGTFLSNSGGSLTQKCDKWDRNQNNRQQATKKMESFLCFCSLAFEAEWEAGQKTYVLASW